MSTITIDESVIQWNVAESDRVSALSERPLLVLLHGYGSFEGDLIGLAPALPQDFVCASLRAPIRLGPPIVNGFGWYEITNPGHPDLPVLLESTQAVREWLRALDSSVPGGLNDIALMGFSQGGLMVTMLMRSDPARYAAGVVCSGFSADVPSLDDAELAARRPPVFWGRDVDDPIIAQVAIDRTQAWLPQHSSLTERLYPGIGHSISREEISDISAFLIEHVPGANQ